MLKLGPEYSHIIGVSIVLLFGTPTLKTFKLLNNIQQETVQIHVNEHYYNSPNERQNLFFLKLNGHAIENYMQCLFVIKLYH